VQKCILLIKGAICIILLERAKHRVLWNPVFCFLLIAANAGDCLPPEDRQFRGQFSVGTHSLSRVFFAVT
jgi:hypothetical protein